MLPIQGHLVAAAEHGESLVAAPDLLGHHGAVTKILGHLNRVAPMVLADAVGELAGGGFVNPARGDGAEVEVVDKPRDGGLRGPFGGVCVVHSAVVPT